MKFDQEYPTWQELVIHNAWQWLERIESVDDVIHFWNLHGPNLNPYPDIERI